MTATPEAPGLVVVIKSPEAVTAFLVNSTVTVNNVNNITSAADNLWNQISVSSGNVNTNINMPLTGLLAGTYRLFTADAAGNLSAVATNTQQVLPIVIDLNRDGVLGYGNVVMDVNGDGLLDATRWAGALDGVLVWDKYGDGLVHDHSQYAFAQYDTTSAALGKTATDLSGLADGFDSNRDGVFNASDALFASFSVWQDANQNGVSDAGEVKTLAEWGLASLNLTSDGVARSPVTGVHEAGQTQFTTTEGTKLLVADVGFDFTTLPVVDLAADLTANTLNIALSDLLAAPQQKVVVHGAANDSVRLAGEGWTNTGTLAAQNGHIYDVWNNSTAQALIDHQMMKSVYIL